MFWLHPTSLHFTVFSEAIFYQGRVDRDPEQTNKRILSTMFYQFWDCSMFILVKSRQNNKRLHWQEIKAAGIIQTRHLSSSCCLVSFHQLWMRLKHLVGLRSQHSVFKNVVWNINSSFTIMVWSYSSWTCLVSSYRLFTNTDCCLK